MPPNIITNDEIIIFEPEENIVNSKVEINGSEVSLDVESFNITKVSKDRLSNFSIDLQNERGKYNKELNPGDIIEIWLDYEDATSKQFRGKIDIATPGLSGTYFMRVQGRNRPELTDNTDLIISFDEESIVDAIKAVIDDLNTVIGYIVVTYDDTLFPTTSETISRNFRNVSYLQALREIAQKAKWEFNIRDDENGTIEFLERNTKKLVTDVISSGINFMGTDGIKADTTYVKNVIRVEGQNVEGCLVMWTETTDIATWRKTEVINDVSCTTRQQCKDRALLELNEKGTPRLQGTIRCTGLPNLTVGYSIEVYIPYILTGTFQIKEYSHSYSNNGFETSVVLEQLADIDLSLVKRNNDKSVDQQLLNNPNNMNYSEVFTFKDDSQTETHSSTNVANGKLNLDSGIDEGTWISKTIVSPIDATKVELRHNGNDDLDISTFEISTDNGDNYTEVTAGTIGQPGTLANIPSGQEGKNIKVRVILSSDTDNPIPAIESLGCYWKGA